MYFNVTKSRKPKQCWICNSTIEAGQPAILNKDSYGHYSCEAYYALGKVMHSELLLAQEIAQNFDKQDPAYYRFTLQTLPQVQGSGKFWHEANENIYHAACEGVTCRLRLEIENAVQGPVRAAVERLKNDL